MEIIVLTGLQASGKSTLRNNYDYKDYEVINLDILKTRKKEDKHIAECVNQCKSFIVDNTNVTIEHRKKYIDIAKEIGCKIVGYYLPITKEESIERNSLRKGTAKVPKIAIYTANKKLVPPTKEEGFDELYEVKDGIVTRVSD